MIGNQVRVVLFDIGGVLVELTGTPMLLSWASSSLSPDDVWVKWLTSPTVRAFETGAIDPMEFSMTTSSTLMQQRGLGSGRFRSGESKRQRRRSWSPGFSLCAG